VYLLLALIFQTSYAQDRTVTGKVVDDLSGSGLPGATVTVKGGNALTGTTTDSEGNYSVRVSPGATSLVFSFIGYRNKEVAINNQSVINVQLNSDVNALSEVIVTGYGS